MDTKDIYVFIYILRDDCEEKQRKVIYKYFSQKAKIMVDRISLPHPELAYKKLGVVTISQQKAKT